MEDESVQSLIPVSGSLCIALKEGFQGETMGPDVLEGFQETPLKPGGLMAQYFHLYVAEEPHADVGTMKPGERTSFFTQVPTGFPRVGTCLSRGNLAVENRQVQKIRLVEKYLFSRAARVLAAGAGFHAVAVHDRIQPFNAPGDTVHELLNFCLV